MFKRYFAVFLVLALAISLTGCGRHRGSGNPAAPEAPKSPSSLLSTKVEKPTVSIDSSVRAAIRASTAALTGAEVEIFLANGKTATLKEDLETLGLYHLDSSDEIPAISYPFAINAKKGAVLIQALVTSQTEAKDELVTCDHTSTAIVQVAQLTAGNANVTDFSSLLLDGTTLTFIDNLKETIENKINVPTVIQTVIAVVSNAIYYASETETEPALANLSSYKKALEELESQEPQTPDTRETIIALAESFVSLFQKAHNKKAGYNAEITEEEKAMLSDNFSLSGYNKESFLNNFNVSTVGRHEISAINHNIINPEKLSNDLYLVHLNGIMDYINYGKNETSVHSSDFDSAKQGYRCNEATFGTFELEKLSTEFNYFPIMVGKEGAAWKIMGNQIKVKELYLDLVRNLQIKNSEVINNNIWLIATNYEGSYSFDKLSLLISGESREIENINSNEPKAISLNQDPKAGDTYKFKVDFKDGTSQTYVHKILSSPYAIDENTLDVNLDTPGKVTVTWPQADASDFVSYSCQINKYINEYEEEFLDSFYSDMISQNSVTFDFFPHFEVIFQIKLKSGVRTNIFYEYEQNND